MNRLEALQDMTTLSVDSIFRHFKIKIVLPLLIRTGTTIYPDVKIGSNLITGHNALIRSNVIISGLALLGIAIFIIYLFRNYNNKSNFRFYLFALALILHRML